jgi:hypothetical protein
MPLVDEPIGKFESLASQQIDSYPGTKVAIWRMHLRVAMERKNAVCMYDIRPLDSPLNRYPLYMGSPRLPYPSKSDISTPGKDQGAEHDGALK